jgi:hypothetical protein
VQAMQEKVVQALEQRGPLTGWELRETLIAEGFALWKACMLSDRVAVERVGRQYLRLDRKVGSPATGIRCRREQSSSQLTSRR